MQRKGQDVCVHLLQLLSLCLSCLYLPVSSHVLKSWNPKVKYCPSGASRDSAFQLCFTNPWAEWDLGPHREGLFGITQKPSSWMGNRWLFRAVRQSEVRDAFSHWKPRMVLGNYVCPVNLLRRGRKLELLSKCMFRNPCQSLLCLDVLQTLQALTIFWLSKVDSKRRRLSNVSFYHELPTMDVHAGP